VTSPVPYPIRARSVAFPSPQNSAGNPNRTPGRIAAVSSLTALSVEFVAKPQEARLVERAIPKAIVGALQDVNGFAGCLVMISDQEARLVTAVTLWAGEDRVQRCKENLRWVHALLAPYLDRCLRVQTLVACLPAWPASQPETNAVEKCLIGEEHSSQEETVCIV
jgi:hypothetical protein